MFEYATLIISILAWVGLTMRYEIMLLNLFQQHEYNNPRFLRSVVEKTEKIFRLHEIILTIWFAIQVVLNNFIQWEFLLTINLFLFVLANIWSVTIVTKQEKSFVKKLVFTPRIYRLLIASIILIAGEFLALTAIKCKLNLDLFSCIGNNTTQILMILILIIQLMSLTIVLANIALSPLNSLINNYYLFLARKKLNESHPYVIGVTGSYGKTSTKYLIAEILKLEYSEFEILSTPKSFNTLMGVCKTINENLNHNHKYFVVEMGAYKPGEIKKICQLVKPQIGVLTAIGPQHLERFKTIEKITKAKFELIKSLPANGVAIFNGDNPFCKELSTKSQVKTLLYGTESDENFEIKAKNILMSIKGTEFDIEMGSETSYHVKMQLLGHHNVSNALAAILIASECGVSIKRAAQSLLMIKPFEHRMQLIQNPQGITIIDNAYSSNPLSATMSLHVVQALQVMGRRILVTPGFAELGVIQDEEHFKLGQNAANIFDYVFLVGDNKRIEPMMKGLMDKGFAKERIYLSRSHTEARKILMNISLPGDIILFENDLPDIY